jgi:hypothetical protein
VVAAAAAVVAVVLEIALVLVDGLATKASSFLNGDCFGKR